MNSTSVYCSVEALALRAYIIHTSFLLYCGDDIFSVIFK